MCNRCADLEEQVAYLKSELGLSRDATELAALQSAFGLTGNEARMVSALYSTHPRTLSRQQLLDATKRDVNSEPELYIVRVYVSKIRAKLGDDFIRTDWGCGYHLGDEAVAEVSRRLKRSTSTNNTRQDAAA